MKIRNIVCFFVCKFSQGQQQQQQQTQEYTSTRPTIIEVWQKRPKVIQKKNIII